MLGNDRAKYLTPKVGIVLHGDGNTLRDSLQNMQIISGNTDMAMYPLMQIMDAMIENLENFTKLNPKFSAPLATMKDARERVEKADELLRNRG